MAAGDTQLASHGRGFPVKVLGLDDVVAGTEDVNGHKDHRNAVPIRCRLLALNHTPACNPAFVSTTITNRSSFVTIECVSFTFGNHV